jgi:uncharacterized protein (DUF58 family)
MASLPETHYMRLLPDEITATLSRMEFVARAKKQGAMAGRHTSPNKGFSVVFAEHRQYAPGDDIRDLDWRVFAKTDRYYIKQYIEETNLRATIVLDCSGSMKYRGDLAATVAGRKVSKFEYAQYLAAALAYLMIKQQDAVGLVTFDDRIQSYIKAASRPSQVRLVLGQLDKTEPGRDTRLAATLHEVADRIPSRGLVILLSDCFESAAQIVESFHHFKFRNHEIVLFHIMAEEELTFPFGQSQEFKDLEASGARLKVDPRTIRAAYLHRVKEHVATIERACGQMQADYVPLTTKTHYRQAFSDFIARRSRKMR